MELVSISALQSNCLDNKNEQMNLFQFIISSMSEGVFLLSDKAQVILYANPKLEQMFGYDRNELVNKPYSILNLDDDTGKELQCNLIAVNEAVLEIERVKKDGTPFWTRSRCCRIDHPQYGNVIVSVVEDITLFKEAREKDHVAMINNAYEAERARISRELHDELGQTLTVLKMDIYDLKKHSSGLDSIHTKVCKIENSINQLIAKVRTIAQDLRPVILANYGIEEGIKHLINDLKSKTGIEINLNVTLGDTSIDHEIATALFRILQEALTNTLRHSPSESVDVNLSKSDMGYTLIVRDYDATSLNQIPFGRGLGIVGMRERAAELGGEFSIINEGGVTVRVVIPEKVKR